MGNQARMNGKYKREDANTQAQPRTLNVSVYVCMCLCVYVCMRVCVYVCMRVLCINACMCVCAFVRRLCASLIALIPLIILVTQLPYPNNPSNPNDPNDITLTIAIAVINPIVLPAWRPP